MLLGNIQLKPYVSTIKTIYKTIGVIVFFIIFLPHQTFSNTELSSRINTTLIEEKFISDEVTLSSDNNILQDYTIRIHKDTNYFLEDGIWYGYEYKKYKNFGTQTLDQETLSKYGIQADNTLLIVDKDEVYFATDYRKIRLVDDRIIRKIENKDLFLHLLLQDQSQIELEGDNILLRLYIDTLKITKGKNKDQKIEAIYEYLLNNMQYPEVFDASNGKIMSGLASFKYKVGSCGGYVNTFIYMLSFAGIEGVNRVDGHVIDAKDFPNIGHTWVRIDGKYYDPTFDDTDNSSTGAKRTYFGLPQDLFYVNRYDFGSLPEIIKTFSPEERKALIQLKLSHFVTLYDETKYLIFEYYDVSGENRQKTRSDSLEALRRRVSTRNQKDTISDGDGGERNPLSKIGDTNKAITNIDDLKASIPYYEVQDFVYRKNDTSSTITKIDYYTLTNENFAKLMKYVQDDIQNMVLFNWNNESYRLAYNVVEQ